MLTIVVYHYIRDVQRTPFPALKALSLDAFDAQLDYLARHYTIVGGRDVVAALRGAAPLPSAACWLTFDDGLMDHVEQVVPRLLARGMQGSFFATASAAERRRVLAVHKTQFIRAAASADRLIPALLSAIAPYRAPLSLGTDDELYAFYSTQWDRWDSPEQVFIKSFLQKGLPEPARSEVVDCLFAEFVTTDEAAFAAELYAGVPELAALQAAGMEVGGHGDTHRWLETLARDEQREEIARTREFLATIPGAPTADWVMCYPHGSHNAETLPLLTAASCAIGLGLQPGIVTAFDQPLSMPRLDTNDLPRGADAAPNAWTRAAQAAGALRC